ncbi:MAG: hypothetical protein PHI90_06310 [Clostridia bacterium]|nr:hypothetical protein [Clostridia bacterium]
MNEKYNIIPTLQFQKDIEYYYRKKKYKNIEEDIDSILEKLENGVFVGDEIQNIRLPQDENVYKVRAVNSSLNVGKSNGYRLIYYVVKNDKDIYLLTIYSKKDLENIDNKEVVRLIKLYCI